MEIYEVNAEYIDEVMKSDQVQFNDLPLWTQTLEPELPVIAEDKQSVYFVHSSMVLYVCHYGQDRY